MSKPNVTRTYGPIHFEDLEPHRFEDLVRQLIYDFKEWQTIEATGRSGNDEGFDIRAYEKTLSVELTDNEEGEASEVTHPMEGNLWMIQGKRERDIGPTKVKKILSEIDTKNPPYGYILAASANFSKDSFDVFRAVLRNIGVMEFYLWGKAELEDILLLPKNDRILFTFFGVSLTSRRRSITTDIRSAVIAKNKLYRIFGEMRDFSKQILIRDLKDTNYPFEDKCENFREKPRWKHFNTFRHGALGLWCHNHRYFAYVDKEKKEWDYTSFVELERIFFFNPHIYVDKGDTELKSQNEKLVRDFWNFLPQNRQAYFIIDSNLKYTSIALIDDKGDYIYDMPHLYVDFTSEFGPFSNSIEYFKINKKSYQLTEDYKRIKIFPVEFQELMTGKIYKNKKLELNTESLEEFKRNQFRTFCVIGNKYSYLKARDVISIANSGDSTKPHLAKDWQIQITHIFSSKIIDYIEECTDTFGTRRLIQMQLGKEIDENKKINIYEFILYFG